MTIIARFRRVTLKGNRKRTDKSYICKCNKCKGIVEISESHLKEGRGCPACHGKVVCVGVNDITTTAPWMVEYFPLKSEQAKLYTRGSNKEIDFICPFCKETHRKSISHLSEKRSIGCSCKNTSYPERYMASLLEDIGVNFIRQAGSNVFNWVKDNKRYDFYLPDFNAIIETHGNQHYITTSWGSVEEQQSNDSEKRNNAIKNGIRNYYEIDCSVSDPNFIIKSIKSSGLLDFLGTKEDEINYKEIEINSIKNIKKEICEYKILHPKSGNREISEIFNVSIDTVRRALSLGESIGIYDSSIDEFVNTSNFKKVVQISMDFKTVIKIYDSIKEAEDNLSISKGSITRCCKGVIKSTKGYRWMYYNDYIEQGLNVR